MRTGSGPDGAGDSRGPGRPVEDVAAYADLPDGLLVADEAGTVVVFNSAAARITGVDVATALGKDLAAALPSRGSGRPGLVVLHRPLRAACPASPATPSATCCSPAARGPRHLAVRPQRAARTGPPGARVDPGHPPPRPRGASRAELVSTVAHELRSPLTSVKGFTATLLAKWERFSDDQKRLMLETVNADADRVTRLITELLDIARIDSGRLTVSRQLVDPGPVVRRHVDGLVASGHDRDGFDVQVLTPASRRSGPTPTSSTRWWPTCWKTRCGTGPAGSRSSSSPWTTERR